MSDKNYPELDDSYGLIMIGLGAISGSIATLALVGLYLWLR